MKRPPVVSAFLLWLLLGAGSLFVINSCGAADEDYDLTLQDKVPNAQAIPTKENFERWRSQWTYGDWVVALENQQGSSVSKPQLKTRVVDALLDFHGFEGGSRLRAASVLEAGVSTEVVDLARTRHLAHPPHQRIVGFGRVSLKRGPQLWSNLHEILGIPSIVGHALERQSIFETWDALNAVKEFAWVEPDIQSHVFQEYTPPAAIGNPSHKERFETIKAPAALKWAHDNGYKATRQIAVAVIDTGVDYKHPGLEPAMFKNPNGEVEDGVDNDGNGYIDDIYGIDASFEVGEVDTIDPVPGAADLGGAGSKCPEGKNNGACGHGTHVAGIIAARSSSADSQWYGICQACKIYSFRSTERKKDPASGVVLAQNSGISDLAQIRSLAYILNFTYGATDILNIHLVNMSLGKYFRSRSISFLIRSLDLSNVRVIAAAGNENTESPSYPGAFSSVISVCATSVHTDTIPSPETSGSEQSARGRYSKSVFSNFGDWVDICAPGQEIWSTYPGGGGQPDQGTSMASPFVAGAAGYLMSISQLDSRSALETLKNFSDSNNLYFNLTLSKGNELFRGLVKNSGYFFLGFGMLDLENAVKSLKGQGTQNTLSQSRDYVGQQVKTGCIVSSLAGTGLIPSWHFFMSAPFVLFAFWLALIARRKLS